MIAARWACRPEPMLHPEGRSFGSEIIHSQHKFLKDDADAWLALECGSPQKNVLRFAVS
jgi:hypothetical protein